MVLEQTIQQTTDREIKTLVKAVRRMNRKMESLEEMRKVARDRLRALLVQRGENWEDDRGYARLCADSIRASYDAKALDQLIVSDPLGNGWLKEFRKESVVRGSVQVK